MRWRALLGLGVALAGCGAPPPPQFVPVPAPDEIRATLFLIGDAGAPKAGDRVLAALIAEARARPDSSSVVFLGDNVYPRGIPAEDDPTHAEAVRRLDVQLAVARAVPQARVYLVPGNHDWAKHGSDGWDAVRRQGVLARASGAELLPGDGCPGPVRRAIPGDFVLLLLDTQWWLHGGPKPDGPDDGCATWTTEAVLDSLGAGLAAARGRAIVVGHHPYRTHGVHGGHFGVLEHLFPLREWKSWLWVPLPILGSAHPIARQNGITSQDLSGAANRRMRAGFAARFAAAPPLAYAAGHDHSLQVLSDPHLGAAIVSGAGYADHVDPVGRGDDTRFAANRSGFVRLDRLSDGRVRLAVIAVPPTGAIEVHSEWIAAPPSAGTPP